jgi:rSAM/selenodomain-associated transferase 2/rSAM/selenodomain-associated transferase 1
MIEIALGTAERFCGSNEVDLEVRYEGGSAAEMRRVFGRHRYAKQGRGDLGEKMARALREGLEGGGGSVVIIGTDCPWISERILEEAFEALREFDIVFGPALDGGYYLVGSRRFDRRLFEGIDWGTGRVLGDSLSKALSVGLSFALLDELRDVDRPGDLPAWREFLAARQRCRVSVVIPALNEEDNIAVALEEPLSAGAEVIVTDGGSTDGTVEIARSLGAKVIVIEGGKARQLNAAACEATGEVLVFLHADSRAPRGFAEEAVRLLARDGVVGGAFTFRLDERMPGTGFIERLADLRSRRLGLPYGDQGIFVRADVFRGTGGFPEMPIMEDFEFMRRLRRHGRIVISHLPVVTSARRWRELGVFRTTAINQLMIAGYYAGVRPERLARLYRRLRS